MSVSQIILSAAELIGTVAFSLSGAMVAMDCGLDLFGVLFLGVVTALGGGTIRDLLLGINPPGMFYNYKYVLIAAVVAAMMFTAVFAGRNHYMQYRKRLDKVLNLFDAVGLGVFAVIGTQAGIAAGHSGNAFVCVFLGMTTGVGGGILRDLLAGQKPYVFVKHIYALAAIAGALLYYALVWWLQISPSVAVFPAILLVLVIRVLASRFQWNLPKITLPKA